MAQTHLTVTIDFDGQPTETLIEFYALWDRGRGLPHQLHAEARCFIRDMELGRLMPVWFDVHFRDLHGILEPSARANAMLANLRAFRAVHHARA